MDQGSDSVPTVEVFAQLCQRLLGYPPASQMGEVVDKVFKLGTCWKGLSSTLNGIFNSPTL